MAVPGTPAQREVAARAIAALAEVAGAAYEGNAAGNVRHVVALLNAGRTEEDLLAVVRDRGRRWRDDEKMHQHLTPQTVFGPKFGNYLAQAKASGGAPAQTQAERDLAEERRRRLEARPAFDDCLVSR